MVLILLTFEASWVIVDQKLFQNPPTLATLHYAFVYSLLVGLIWQIVIPAVMIGIEYLGGHRHLLHSYFITLKQLREVLMQFH